MRIKSLDFEYLTSNFSRFKNFSFFCNQKPIQLEHFSLKCGETTYNILILENVF